MCGIIGISSNKDVVPSLMTGLKKLEYRGYDSTGIAVNDNAGLSVSKISGKLINLEAQLRINPLSGIIGIGHTRWATHGMPNDINAHPHLTDKLALVHNGIVENYQELREELNKSGYVFETQTDSEVIAKLIDFHLKDNSPLEAVRESLKKLNGSFSIAVLFRDYKDLMIGARHGASLAITSKGDSVCLGSDALALSDLNNEITYLNDGDIVVINKNKYVIYNNFGEQVQRDPKKIITEINQLEKGNFPHYMLKEIYEQPKVINTAFNYYQQLTSFPFELKNLTSLKIIACGTSYYAGQIARYWAEEYAGIEVSVEIASEYRYRNPVQRKDGVAIFISQSGETADTLAALKLAKNSGQKIISVVNNVESSIAYEADLVLPILAGPEIGVASTKAFTAQLTTLACFILKIAEAKGSLDATKVKTLMSNLSATTNIVQEILELSSDITDIAEIIAAKKNVLFVGRGTNFPLAQEAALKLKELSYIHAEAIAAGELKHGTIALIEKDFPVIAIIPSDKLFEKTFSNLQEIHARNGTIIAFTDNKGAQKLKTITDKIYILPEVTDIATPIAYAAPLQLLAYHTALILDRDIDQPRNLAKSVTVE
jgi:glucosamine--fructose-6-phosphate aminotransferase (isomerizing)